MPNFNVGFVIFPDVAQLDGSGNSSSAICGLATTLLCRFLSALS